MKRKLFICICCSLCIALTSCTKYLDVKPKGKVIPKTAEEFSSILHYWLDDIEKGTDDVIVLSPERTADLELFAEDLDGTLASSYGVIDLYAGTSINRNQNYIPLSKIAT